MRILLYSADSYGLGHVNRSLTLAARLLAEFRDASALLLTGAPRAHYFDYPPRCDYIKLPSVTKDHGGRYVSRDLDLTLDETIRLRGRLIAEAAGSLRPGLFIVDHTPLGLCGEVLETLDGLRGRSIRVLGLRDVIDEPARVREVWEREGVIDALRRYYDAILVYGERELFDPIRAYGIPADVARKMFFVGHVAAPAVGADVAAIRANFAPRTGKLVLVALGGGGDGYPLLRSIIDGYEALGRDAPFELVAVTGPLMSPRKRTRFVERARAVDGLEVLEYSHELRALVEAADFVVSMGGYNTVCELAAVGARALLVPRCYPRREQILRAELLASRGMLRYLEPDQATPRALMREVLDGLERPAPPAGWGLRLCGLDRTAQVVGELLSRAAAPAASYPSTSTGEALR